MVTSTLDIWNQALSACRAKGRLSSLDQQSFEREVCQEWYSVVLGTVQEAVMWDCCSCTARLPLLQERDFNLDWADGDPDPAYRYLYALPENYLRARQLPQGQPFVLGFDPTRHRVTLSTNMENAVLQYSRLEDDPTRWSQGQRMATVYGLAAHIAYPLSGQSSMVQKNVQLANNILEAAQSNNANNSNEVDLAMAPWHVARGAVDLAIASTYTYPSGQVFSVPEANV